MSGETQSKPPPPFETAPSAPPQGEGGFSSQQSSHAEDAAQRPRQRITDLPPASNWKAAFPFYDLKLSHWVEIALTLALVFVALSQLVVYQRQTGIMGHQAQISQNQLNAAKSTARAFIDVSELKIEAASSKGGDPFLRVTPVIRNTGTTPAVGLFLVVVNPRNEWLVRPKQFTPQMYSYLSWKLKAPRDPDELIGASVAGTLNLSNFTIGPQGGLTASGLTSEMTAQDGIDAQENKIGRFVYGSIRYSDIFGAQHISKFCFRTDGIHVRKPGEIELWQNLCAHWNCTDEYCRRDKDAYQAELKKVLSERLPWQLPPRIAAPLQNAPTRRTRP